MGSFQLSYVQLLYLLISALLDCKAQTERPCKQVDQFDVNYVQGDDMSISCLSTPHALDSLTVKLRKTNPVKDIIICSDPPASEHQRWSVRNDAGNVTLYLKDISLSDDGLYDCQVYNGLDCLKATHFNLSVIKCKPLNPVHATANTSVLLPCSEHSLQNSTDRVTWKIVTGHQSTEITQYRPPHKPSNSTERVLRPLYERVRILGNGSLLIRDAVNTDGSWYRCRVNETTCYDVKLVMKDYGTSHSTKKMDTFSTTCPTCHTADIPVVQTEGNIAVSPAVTTNLTVVIATIVSLCVLISLIICVILYFKKRRSKINRESTLNCRFSVYYSQIAEGLDVPVYSLVEQSTGTMTTFCAEQTEEASACKPDDI
ncbi:uncharacterized protein LOC125242806 isoform X1 [Megalobrama amblycephala]|uniref:uncharacterized protein LOC125242806 isoform X1 n=2 Tax=Megalobrama amblycephala TaxID=75352 RepID=UPI0020146D63|nr:uncharacterized protein LOC125242806 isoform X1 [Megalobrama amblycephala]